MKKLQEKIFNFFYKETEMYTRITKDMQENEELLDKIKEIRELTNFEQITYIQRIAYLMLLQDYRYELRKEVKYATYVLWACLIVRILFF